MANTEHGLGSLSELLSQSEHGHYDSERAMFPTANITFHGTDGNECEAFVVAIRDLALANGKDEDNRWRLRYATSRLRGKALRWHAKLDPSVRKDWDLFVQALFEEYPWEEGGDEAGIATPVWTSTTFSPSPFITQSLPGNKDTPTAAPVPLPAGEGIFPLGAAQPSSSFPLDGGFAPYPRVYDPSLPGFQIGRLRVVYEQGRPGPHYIWCGYDVSGNLYAKRVTSNIYEALTVTFIPSSEPHQIVCTNPGQLWAWNLGVRIFPVEQSEFHPLIGTWGAAVPCSRKAGDIKPGYEHQDVSRIWNILSDGTLCAKIADLAKDPKDSKSQIPSDAYSTSTVYAEISGASVSFAKEFSAPQATHPVSECPIVRARIVFEPI